MLLEVSLGGLGDLEGDELEAALLEAADDLADESALDAVGPVQSVYVKGKSVWLCGVCVRARRCRSVELVATPARTPPPLAGSTHLIMM